MFSLKPHTLAGVEPGLFDYTLISQTVRTCVARQTFYLCPENV
jgi:hypothetical protein